MILHVVLVRPRGGLSAEDRASILRELAAAAEIPSVRRLRVGRRIRHGLPGYEQAMREDLEYAVLIEFDDLAALQQYLAHPAHAAVARRFTESADAALAYDYELVEASDLSSLT